MAAALVLLLLISRAAAQSTCSDRLVGSNSNVGSCTCNLLYNWCDTNCCCDPDCSSQQTATFSSCISQKPADPELCSVSSSFGCLFYDNYQDRLYYASKPITCDVNTFQQNMSQYSSVYTFQPQLPTVPLLNSNYTPGDPLYAIFSGTSVDYFILPRPAGTSNLCVDSAPAAYLVDQSTSCVRTVTTPLTDCVANALSAQTYVSGVSFLTKPPPSTCASLTAAACVASAQSQGTVSLTYTIITSSGTFTSYTAALAPSNSSSTCLNVVTQVQYTVTHNYQSGITAIQAAITLSTVTSSLIYQKFSINFVPVNLAAPTLPRSGNPGYLVGQPVLAGAVASDSRSGIPFIETSSNVYQQLPVLSPLGSASSSCLQCISNAACYQPVLFGINYRTGCVFNMTYNNFTNNCNDISSLLQVMLWPWNTTAVNVAAFGNYTTDMPGSFVPVNNYAPSNVAPSASAGLCTNMITGLTLQFLYQRTNTLANPQMRIVGAQYQYITQNVGFRCVSPYCNSATQASAAMPVEVKVIVQFIDASQTTTQLEKLIPDFLAELPYDFFYPFGLSAAANNGASVLLLLSVAVLHALGLNL